MLARADIPTLDVTGGAPEMNPHFRWLVARGRRLGRHVIDRCNLTILLAPGFDDLPDFLAEQRVEVVASLPCYLAENTDAQRGERRLREVDRRPAAAQRPGLRPAGQRAGPDPGLQPGRPVAAAAAAGPGGRLPPARLPGCPVCAQLAHH